MSQVSFMADSGRRWQLPLFYAVGASPRCGRNSSTITEPHRGPGCGRSYAAPPRHRRVSLPSPGGVWRGMDAGFACNPPPSTGGRDLGKFELGVEVWPGSRGALPLAPAGGRGGGEGGSVSARPGCSWSCILSVARSCLQLVKPSERGKGAE